MPETPPCPPSRLRSRVAPAPRHPQASRPGGAVLVVILILVACLRVPVAQLAGLLQACAALLATAHLARTPGPRLQRGTRKG